MPSPIITFMDNLAFTANVESATHLDFVAEIQDHPGKCEGYFEVRNKHHKSWKGVLQFHSNWSVGLAPIKLAIFRAN